ncbi:MAG: copper resistance protein NlpE [Methylococcaceae bacterium]|nr:copper resistance protein NlpE [Methylococcaceae bacterium]
MRTARQNFKHILTFFLFISISSVYCPAFAETSETTNKDAHHAQNSLDWPGIYYGFLPCDDCKGVKATLALNKNSSYILIRQYVGKSEREVVEKGKFTWGEKNNTIILIPRNSTTSKQYFVGENKLIELDNNGNRITGKLADRYILRRKDIEEPLPHSSH